MKIGLYFGTFNPIHFSTLTRGLSTASNSHGSALCESKLDSTLLYAGTGDGKVWRVNTRTITETDISAGLPNRHVTSLTTSAIDPGLVVVTHSGYLDFQTIPHISLSTDSGSRWTPITGDLPSFALNDAEILDNTNDSVIFVASDVGVYVTYNRGVNWSRIGGNMPMIPVNDIAIDYKANRLIAGTFARSMQSFDLDSIIILDSIPAVDPIVKELDIGEDTTLCKGDTLEIGTDAFYSNYNWSTGETTPTIRVFSSGSVWLEVQTNNGTLRDSITIIVDDLPSKLFLGNDTAICLGGSIELGRGIPNFDSYIWNTGSTTKTIVITSHIIYDQITPVLMPATTCLPFNGQLGIFANVGATTMATRCIVIHDDSIGVYLSFIILNV